MNDVKEKSNLILSEVRKRRKNKEVVNVEEDRVKVAVFSLGTDGYGFYSRQIKRILPVDKEPSYIPGLPNFILGVINDRGNMEAVINMHSLMKLPQLQYTIDSRIIVISNDNIRAGVVVDSVLDVKDFYISEIKETISTIGDSIKQYVNGSLDLNGVNVNLLDINKILDSVTI